MVAAGSYQKEGRGGGGGEGGGGEGLNFCVRGALPRTPAETETMREPGRRQSARPHRNNGDRDQTMRTVHRRNSLQAISIGGQNQSQNNNAWHQNNPVNTAADLCAPRSNGELLMEVVGSAGG